MLASISLGTYLDDLTSVRPAPGGGSAAAVSGAMAAALVGMVCNLTLDDETYAGVHDAVARLLQEAGALRCRLLLCAEEDARIAGDMVRKVHALRAERDPAHSPLRAQVQQSLRASAGTALSTAEACADTLRLCEVAARIGKVAALSDAGVAAALAEAGLIGAQMTVETNLNLIEDSAFVLEQRERVESLARGVSQVRGTMMAHVRG